MTAMKKSSSHPTTSSFLEYKPTDIITTRIYVYVYTNQISRHQTFKNNMVEGVANDAKAKEPRSPPANTQQLEK